MTPALLEWLILASAVAAGAAVQAATGFGFAILAAPVFLATLDSTAAIPILVALHIAQCVVLVPGVLSSVPWREFRILGLGALLGCPLGFMLFHMLEVRQLKLAVGVVILIAAALLAFRRSRALGGGKPPVATSSVQGTASLGASGALSGALTAVLVMPGPPLMVHLLRHPLPMPAARSVSIAFFAACYAAVLIAHIATGSLGGEEWSRIQALLAPVLVGTFAGLRLAPWFATRHLAPMLNVLLLLAGLGSLWSALRAP